jgi:protein-disulfide isomerase
VEAQFNSQIYVQFRNLPLTSLHKNAFAAARAAEAAGLQGKYWQMHDKIYENQDPTGQSGWVASDNPLSFFTAYAQAIGLNMTQFKSDYASDKVNSTINADLAAFAKTGQQQATPTYFLDGKYISNAELANPTTGEPSVSLFAKVINAEITAKSKQ